MSAAPASRSPRDEMPDPVSYEVRDAVALLVIDNPPVNASTQAVRAGLIDGLRKAATDDAVVGVVIAGNGANLIAGSDLGEFAAFSLPEPQLPQVIAAIEVCPKPVVAAVSGATLGGGLELALGCDGRVASASSVVGFPEITLGMIPGAGGTQRTLRLVGPRKTLDLVTSGRRVAVTEPLGRALVDEVVDGDPTEAALARARTRVEKRNLMDEPPLLDDPGEVEAAAQAAIAEAQGTPEVIAAVGAVLAGLALPSRRALDHERGEFTRLRTSADSAALRHGFFATMAAKRASRPSEAIDLRSVAVVGAGTMGRGIARAFLEAGLHVTIYDEKTDAARAAQRQLGTRLSVADTFEGLAGHDLYIEAVFEEIEVKSKVLAALEGLATDAPLATNTSYLDIEQLADSLRSPARLVGMHFFSPAHRTRVLEVISAERTSSTATDAALTAARLLGKQAIRSRPGPGFIGNRIYNAYRWQCELMLEEGALPQQIDAAMDDFGFAMGPFAVWDMSGLDVACRMRRATAADRDPAARYPEAAEVLCDQGRLGQKTGLGWYRYVEGSRSPVVDPTVAELIETIARRKGVARRTFSSQEISRRALLAMANEASLLLREGVSDRVTDVDLMLVLGYGFPARRGGIGFWVRSQDRRLLESELDELALVTGSGFRRGDLGLLGVGKKVGNAG